MTSATTPLTVLEITNRPDGTTRYIDQIVTFASRNLRFDYFSWPRAFRGRYDVLHVHWPEMLVRGRSRASTVGKCILVIALIAVLKVRRVPIVRTLHNVEPHEQGTAIERRTLAALDKVTALFVTINPVTSAPAHSASVYIPHGHYRERFAEHPKSDIVPGRLLYAGLIRPYKGIERLIASFEALPHGAETLRIVGRPTPDLRRTVEEAASRDPRITARLEFVPDADLVSELTQAELVCLPYDELHNSGMVLVALSLNRPVMVPDTETTSSLGEEVGEGWVHRLKGPLTDVTLREVIEQNRAAASTRAAFPVLEDRDWRLVAQRYESAFRLARAGR